MYMKNNFSNVYKQYKRYLQEDVILQQHSFAYTCLDQTELWYTFIEKDSSIIVKSNYIQMQDIEYCIKYSLPDQTVNRCIVFRSTGCNLEARFCCLFWYWNLNDNAKCKHFCTKNTLNLDANIQTEQMITASRLHISKK